jgi:hypothetical protein
MVRLGYAVVAPSLLAFGDYNYTFDRCRRCGHIQLCPFSSLATSNTAGPGRWFSSDQSGQSKGSHVPVYTLLSLILAQVFPVDPHDTTALGHIKGHLTRYVVSSRWHFHMPL